MARQRAAGSRAPEAPERPGARRGGISDPDLDLGAITGPYRQSEASFQRQVIQYAELMGWHWYHNPDSRRSHAGWPDLVLIRRPRCLFVELKAQRTRVTTAQRWWLAELRACGQEVYLFRPSDWKIVEKVLR